MKAGVAKKCYHSTCRGMPLAAGRNDKRFKVYFFDIGLAQRMMELDLKAWISTPLEVTYLGAIAEQFVAQEMIAYANSEMPGEIYYWHREGRSVNAEVDFVFVNDGQIIPAEVKSGTQGGMKSLSRFIESYPNTPYGLKISQNMSADFGQLRDLAFYGLEAWSIDPGV